MKTKEMAVIKDIRKDGSYIWMDIKTEKIASNSVAGQFVNIRVNETLDPLLRRPVSICKIEGDVLTLLILIKGKGTKILSEKRPGDLINIIGPLGKGFPETKRKVLFAGGGVGVAPFLFLSEKYPGSELLFGTRTKSLIPDLKPFEKNCKIHTATDDGTAGIKGNVLDLLKNYDLSQYSVYACGPNPMFKAMAEFFKTKQNVEAYFSLETMMGCGFGACKGCTVETPSGDFKLACMDGPVFPWNEVLI